MKNLILIIGENKFQFDTPNELYDEILGKVGETYHDLSPQEKEQRRYEKAFINSKGNKEKITKLSETAPIGLNSDNYNKFFIDSDETYLLSLLNMGIMMLLEEKSSNFFTSSIDKSSMEDNYIIVNRFSPTLLKEQQKLLQTLQKQNDTKEISK